ncbi:unannotated protein [freshwater metagenome]|uniref:Unannotated protein n=1 Tax=freshwater metagenome TaxID=449393 RepID=A0A6J7TZD2_9ZZZZ
MKLLSLWLTTFKSKLYAIVLVSLVVRVIGFFLLPNQPTVALAPDEGGYAEIGKLVTSGQPTTSYGGLYKISRSLVLPASLLNKIGIEPLSSVRIIASVYGFCTLLLVVKIILKTIDINEVREIDFKKSSAIVALFAIFAFLPSHLLWSMLGLRESPMEFWVMSALASIYWVFYIQKQLSLQIVLWLVVSIVLIFNSRPQVGWVLGVTLLIILLFKVRNRIAIVLIPVTLIALGLGYASVSLSLQKQDVFMLVATDGTATDGTACKDSNEKIIVQKVEYICKKTGEKKSIIGLQNPAEVVFEQTQGIPLHHDLNQVDAASMIQTLSCPNSGETKFDKNFCMLWRAPYMSATFLFRPAIEIDVTSRSSFLAALENILWTGAFIFIITMLIKKRRLALLGPITPSLIFFGLYSVGAGSYEGNMGTAFRHKSLILWVVLLLLASAILAKKTPTHRNESSGNAV